LRPRARAAVPEHRPSRGCLHGCAPVELPRQAFDDLRDPGAIQSQHLIRPLRDRHGPFRPVAQGHARDTQNRGLLLNPAGVRQHARGSGHQAQEVQVSERVHQPNAVRGHTLGQAGLGDALPGAGVGDQEHGEAGRSHAQDVHHLVQRLVTVHVGRPVQGGHQVSAGVDPESIEDLRALGDRKEGIQAVDHHVPDKVDPVLGNTLRQEVHHGVR
jgi:hypothetical protein